MTPPFVFYSLCLHLKTFFHPSFFTSLSLHADRIISFPPLPCHMFSTLTPFLLSIKRLPLLSYVFVACPFLYALTFLPSTLQCIFSDTIDRWPVGLPRIPRLAFTLCATPPVFVCCGVFQELPPPLGTYTADVLTGFSQVTESPNPYLTFALFQNSVSVSFYLPPHSQLPALSSFFLRYFLFFSSSILFFTFLS